MKLLTTNAKLDKRNDGIDADIVGLSLAPANHSGYNLCAYSTPGCRAICNLWFSGRTVQTIVRTAMVRRSLMLINTPALFATHLASDLETLAKRCTRNRSRAFVRLNTASDIDYIRQFPGVIDLASSLNIQLYDYTKSIARCEREIDNWEYQLTYSWNERSDPHRTRNMLNAGGNVAMVFDTHYNPQHGRIDPLPKTWRIGGQEFLVVDGDTMDVRTAEFDGSGVIVGLRGKGGRKKVKAGVASGFILEAGGAHD